jgi:hypothetical protein
VIVCSSSVAFPRRLYIHWGLHTYTPHSHTFAGTALTVQGCVSAGRYQRLCVAPWGVPLRLALTHKHVHKCVTTASTAGRFMPGCRVCLHAVCVVFVQPAQRQLPLHALCGQRRRRSLFRACSCCTSCISPVCARNARWSRRIAADRAVVRASLRDVGKTAATLCAWRPTSDDRLSRALMFYMYITHLRVSTTNRLL